MAAINESLNQKMTALADEVRELSGATEALNIDAMTTNIGEANDEVNEQTDLITQIKNAVDMLPEAGSGGTSNNINVCNITITSFNQILFLAYTAQENNTIIVKTVSSGSSTQCILTNVICGSAISFNNNYNFNAFMHSHDSQYIGHYTLHMWVLSAPTINGVDATITVYDDE